MKMRKKRKWVKREDAERFVVVAKAEGVILGWQVGHGEACDLGEFCSRHQPISARPEQVAAVIAADEWARARGLKA